jgi:hypothetical protein
MNRRGLRCGRQLQGVIMEFENILEPPVKLEDIKVVEDGED